MAERLPRITPDAGSLAYNRLAGAGPHTGPLVVPRYVTPHTMIMTFAHKSLEAFFKKGTKAGIRAAHADRLRRQLAQLEQAQSTMDKNLPGWRLHQLVGNLAGHWAVTVNGGKKLGEKQCVAQQPFVDTRFGSIV